MPVDQIGVDEQSRPYHPASWTSAPECGAGRAAVPPRLTLFGRLSASLWQCFHAAHRVDWHAVYLADPADIETVFASDPSVFHAGEANSILSGLVGDTSLLVIDASACGLNTTEQGLSIASQIAAKVPT
jgi:cytochrome P450